MSSNNTGDKDNTVKRSDSSEDSNLYVTNEQKVHLEHLRRLRKYKKKHKQQIVGLGLELLLLVVVIGGYLAISWGQKIIHNFTIHDTTPPATISASGVTTAPGESLIPATDASGETIRTTVPVTTTTIEQVSWTDTEGFLHTDTMPPEEPYTNPRPNKVVEAQEGYETFVIFGVDARDNHNLLRGAQGDVVILVSIDKLSGDMRLASVYRDFFFEFTTGQFCKLTDAYIRYGAEQVVSGLNRNLDLNITHFVTVNWAALIEAVDMLGGIETEVTAAEALELDQFIKEIEDATGKKTHIKDWNYEPGVKYMDGVYTVAYTRIRKNDTGGDFGRTERQRKVIGILLDKIKHLNNLSDIVSLVEMISLNVKTNMDSRKIIDMGLNAKRYKITETVGFPKNYVSIEAKYYFLADSQFSQDVSDLHHFLYQLEDYEPSENVKRIEAAHTHFILTGEFEGPDN